MPIAGKDANYEGSGCQSDEHDRQLSRTKTSEKKMRSPHSVSESRREQSRSREGIIGHAEELIKENLKKHQGIAI